MNDNQSATVIDTPEGIRTVALLQLAHRLAIEINTGMGFRQSSLAAAQNQGLTIKRTKKGALRDVVAAIKVVHPSYEPSARVASAMK